MTDIVTRLRSWVHAVDVFSASDLMDDAAGEIERLRLAIRRLAEQDATLSVVGGNVIVEMECQDSSHENFTLTDEEREAIEWAVATLDAESALGDGEFDRQQAATLRSLLERTK